LPLSPGGNKKLEDIDVGVLEILIKKSVEFLKKKYSEK